MLLGLQSMRRAALVVLLYGVLTLASSSEESSLSESSEESSKYKNLISYKPCKDFDDALITPNYGYTICNETTILEEKIDKLKELDIETEDQLKKAKEQLKRITTAVGELEEAKRKLEADKTEIAELETKQKLEANKKQPETTTTEITELEEAKQNLEAKKIVVAGFEKHIQERELELNPQMERIRAEVAELEKAIDMGPTETINKILEQDWYKELDLMPWKKLLQITRDRIKLPNEDLVPRKGTDAYKFKDDPEAAEVFRNEYYHSRNLFKEYGVGKAQYAKGYFLRPCVDDFHTFVGVDEKITSGFLSDIKLQVNKVLRMKGLKKVYKVEYSISRLYSNGKGLGWHFHHEAGLNGQYAIAVPLPEDNETDDHLRLLIPTLPDGKTIQYEHRGTDTKLGTGYLLGQDFFHAVSPVDGERAFLGITCYYELSEAVEMQSKHKPQEELDPSVDIESFFKLKGLKNPFNAMREKTCPREPPCPADCRHFKPTSADTKATFSQWSAWEKQQTTVVGGARKRDLSTSSTPRGPQEEEVTLKFTDVQEQAPAETPGRPATSQMPLDTASTRRLMMDPIETPTDGPVIGTCALTLVAACFLGFTTVGFYLFLKCCSKRAPPPSEEEDWSECESV